jgi:NADPH:quinone reductase-like Zn-dependent oxidoreductase
MQLMSQIPENINFEGAATIPFSLATAACSLFVSLGINYDKPLTEAIPILIWVSVCREPWEGIHNGKRMNY